MKIFTVLVFVIAFTAQSQQTGKLAGVVRDSSNGEILIGANIVLLETTRGTVTNFDGKFEFNDLPAGIYKLQVSYVSYAKKTILRIAVVPDKTTTLDIRLRPEAYEMEEVVVTAEAITDSEASMLALQKKAAGISDAISEERMKKAGDSDAADAIKRVTGVSIVGAKYAYVRGLGERYNATQVNDVPVPSPEPEKKVVPYDLFPSNLIQNMVTEKTFTPDQPGNFSGAMVRITTREFPKSFFVNTSLSSGMNSMLTSGMPATAQNSLDFMGFDNGKRALPEGIPIALPSNRPTTSESAAFASLFSNDWTPRQTSPMPNLGFSLATGNKFDWDGMPFGYLASLTYSSEQSYRITSERYPTQEIDASTGRPILKDDYIARQGTYSVLWGALLNFAMKPSATDKISLKTMFNRSMDDEARLIDGYSAQGSSSGFYKASRQRFVGRSIFSSVLSGDHEMTEALGSRLEWLGSFSIAERDEPDNRETVYALEQSTGRYFFPNNFGSANGRFFSDLLDYTGTVGADWLMPVSLSSLESLKMKTGFHGERRTRDFSARRFIYGNVRADVQYLPADQLLTAEQVAAGNIDFTDATAPNDKYEASENTYAGYAMFDIAISKALRIVTGARIERVETQVDSYDPYGALIGGSLNARLNTTNVLPALSATYALSESMNLRAAATRTVGRPEFRELAPFRFDDYRTSTYGNAALTSTDITNLDLRWEWYPNPGELISVSAFLKDFVNPIEKVLFPSANNNFVIPINASSARNVGLEFEARKNLGFISGAFESLNAGVNVAIVSSEIRFDPNDEFAVQAIPGLTSLSPAGFANTKRPLEGQSPYIINANLEYTITGLGTAMYAAWHVAGKRIREVGVNGFDDTYELARNVIDITITQPLFTTLSLRVAMKNLLDEDVIYRMGDLDVQRYRMGRSFSLSFSYSF